MHYKHMNQHVMNAPEKMRWKKKKKKNIVVEKEELIIKKDMKNKEIMRIKMRIKKKYSTV